MIKIRVEKKREEEVGKEKKKVGKGINEKKNH